MAASDSASASPESRALRCHSDSLITAITHPLNFALELLAKEIIEEATVDRVSLPNQTNRDKNSVLVLVVMRRVEARSSLFHDFIDLLKDSEDHILKELGGKLESELQEQMSLATKQLPHSPSPPTQQIEHPPPPPPTEQIDCSPPSPATHPSLLSLPPQSPVRRYADYLRAFYQTSELPASDKWPPSPSETFINLAVISREKVSRKDLEKFMLATLHGGVDQIVDIKAPIEIGNILSPQVGKALQCVLVEGAPGVGKTTLAWEVSKQWGMGNLFQQFTIVMLLRLRHQTVQNAKSLADLVFNQDQDCIQNISKYLKDIKGRNILFILDGLDELPTHLLTQSSVFTRLLSGNLLTHATILVTSRPSATAHLWNNWKHRISRHIEVFGFTDKNISQYIASVLSPQEIRGFQDYFSINPHIRTIMYIPLHAAIVIEVYRICQESSRTLPTTITELYTVIVQTILLRYITSQPDYKGEQVDLNKFTNLPPPVYNLFYNLARLAYKGVTDQQFIFKHQQHTIHHLGFMVAVTELYPNQLAVTYSYNFLHHSIQEYLAAYYVSTMEIPQQEQLLRRMCAETHLQNMGRFFAGITKFAGIDKAIIRKITEEEKLGFLEEATLPSTYVSQIMNSIAEEKRHLKAIKTALEKKGSLKQTIMHCLFFGHPRGGKSSLMKRLTGHPPPDPNDPNISNSPSTGVVEKVKIYTSTAMVLHSKWSPLTLDDEAIALMAIADQTASHKSKASLEHTNSDPGATASISAKVTLPTSSETTPGATPTAGDYNESTPIVPSAETNNIAELDALSQDDISPMKVLREAIKQRGLEGIKQYLQGSLTLYLTDTGGQMEFQELSPALFAGPSVFFVVFRLDQDLNETFTIEYLHPNGQSAKPYLSSFSVKETLFQSLASIASMGTYVYNTDLKKKVPLKPKVVLVGTHKDKVSPEQIEKIDSDLQQMIKPTSLYRNGLIEFASEDHLVVTVNNLSPGDSDFQVIRSVVKRITEKGDFEVSSPSTWLILGLIIRQQKSRVITYEKCFSIAQKCGIESHNELNDALRFLSTKLGLVRHFRGKGLKELEEIVIIDPQILFDKITKLIIGTFTFKNVTHNVQEEFKEKGIFPLSALEQLHSSDEEDQLLTVSRLVKLLEHLHVIARLQSDTEEVKYFMPCTLAHAESIAPELVRPQSRFHRFKELFFHSHKEETKLVPPLSVTFECGYCPKGVFSALAVYLQANKMQSRLVWKLQTKCIFKNSISLSVGPYADTMTLTLTPTYLKVSVVPADIEQVREFPIEKICTEVQQCISKAVQEVTSSLNYTSDAKHTLAFCCPRKHKGVKDQHPAKIQFHNGKPYSVQCDMTDITYSLPKHHQFWFADAPSTGRLMLDSDVDEEALDSQHLLEITNYLHNLEKTDLYNLGLVLGLHRHRITDFRERCGCLEFCDSIVDCWLQ